MLKKVHGRYEPTIDELDIELVNSTTDVVALKEILKGIIDKGNTTDIKKTKLRMQIEAHNTINKLQHMFYNMLLAGEGYSTDGESGRKRWNE